MYLPLPHSAANTKAISPGIPTSLVLHAGLGRAFFVPRKTLAIFVKNETKMCGIIKVNIRVNKVCRDWESSEREMLSASVSSPVSSLHFPGNGV